MADPTVPEAGPQPVEGHPECCDCVNCGPWLFDAKPPREMPMPQKFHQHGRVEHLHSEGHKPHSHEQSPMTSPSSPRAGRSTVSAAPDIEPWPRGLCEFWLTQRAMCGKRGRWMVQGEIRCGEHKEATNVR